jgi:hypothetical protein
MTHYALNRDAHVCFLGDQAVVLNLSSGEYLQIQADALRECIGSATTAKKIDDGADTLKDLVASEVLTDDPARTKDLTTAKVTTAMRTLADIDLIKFPKIRLHHIYHFAISFVQASLSLRLFHIRHIVGRANQRRLAPNRATEMHNAQSVCDLMFILHRLSPLAYARANRCLLDCLTTIHFLSRYGIHPEWVFAVRTEPFLAHCWLQLDDLLLNDSLLQVSQFTPIMAV